MPALVLSPEAQLLFRLSGDIDAATADATTDTLLPRVDWNRFFAMAERGNCFPVIWRRLRGIGTSAVPESIAQRMDRRSRVAEFTLLAQAKLLERALETLAAAGIEVVLLKGAGLVPRIYGSFVERPMGDLDLLVRRDDAKRAHELLVANGWIWPHDPALDVFYANHFHLPPLYDARRLGASIELHVDLFVAGHPFRFDAESIWRDRHAARVGTASTWSPSPQHQLLHAAIHYSWSHSFASGAWNTLRDVGALSRSGEIDWPTFLAEAQEARAASCAYWPLWLASELGIAAIPEEVLSELARATRRGMRSLLARHVLALDNPEAACPSARLKRLMWSLAIQPARSGHEQARPWLADSLFTPERTAAEASAGRGLSVRAWTRYLRALIRPR